MSQFDYYFELWRDFGPKAELCKLLSAVGKLKTMELVLWQHNQVLAAEPSGINREKLELGETLASLMCDLNVEGGDG